MDDLIAEFLEETNESLGTLDNEIVTLEQNPDDKAIIDNIFRVMHTIKGTCGFLGLPRLEKVAHAAEDVMDMIRGGKLEATPDVISLVLEAIDCIKELVEHLEEEGTEAEGDDSDLVSRLRACADGEGAGGGEAPAAAAEPEAPAAEQTAPDEEGGAQDSDELQKLFDETEPLVDTPENATPAAAEQKAPDEEGGAKDSDELQKLFDETEPLVDTPANAEKSEAISEDTKEEAVKEGLKATDGGEEAKPKTKEKPASNQSIRVNLDLLENLMQTASELVLIRNQLVQLNRQQTDSKYSTPLQRLNHITTDLQEGVMKTRMQPISNAWSKFPRLVRDLSRDLGKKIDLKMEGEETELDRQLLEVIKDPLTHMVRNSLDHGLEGPEERLEANKLETGTITLSAYHEGGHIIIKISDDGRGVNADKVRKKAVENGMISEAQAQDLSDEQIYQFIFKPGFSTAEEVTAVSGRGVGMDVVVNNIQKIGGTIEVASRPGKGSDFMIKIPLTLAIMSVLIVECQGESFAIPQIRVSEIIRATRLETAKEHGVVSGEGGVEVSEEYVIEMINDTPVLRLRGALLPLVTLDKVLGLEGFSADNDNESPEEDENPFVVICEMGAQLFGIIVDKVFDTEEIVVKPVSRILKSIDVYSGCTILGDGSVIMILDPNGIVKAVGGIDMRGKAGAETKRGAQELDEGVESFLLFRAGGKAPKAVPLELVSRLEEIDMSKVEWAGDQPVIQYRGHLMRFITTEDSEMPSEGIKEVIVFTDQDKVMGLIVEEILDIVEQQMSIKSFVGQDGTLGSMVIEGEACDLIDVSHFFAQTFADWLAEQEEMLPSQTEDGEEGKHILLVDDSPFFRKFMKPILKVAGFEVTTAESALEALEVLEKDNEFDAVVTDIDMPGMTGIEFAEKCKSDNRYKELPFIALTSYTNDEIIEQTKAVGFVGYVSKSDRDSLVSTIESVLATVMSEATGTTG